MHHSTHSCVIPVSSSCDVNTVAYFSIRITAINMQDSVTEAATSTTASCHGKIAMYLSSGVGIVISGGVWNQQNNVTVVIGCAANT